MTTERITIDRAAADRWREWMATERWPRLRTRAELDLLDAIGAAEIARTPAPVVPAGSQPLALIGAALVMLQRETRALVRVPPVHAVYLINVHTHRWFNVGSDEACGDCGQWFGAATFLSPCPGTIAERITNAGI
jgi:hypothetical protein